MYETIFNTCKTLDELKKQYRRLAMKYHPDAGGLLSRPGKGIK